MTMLEIIRGSVRPIVTVISMSVIAQVIVERIPVSIAEWSLLSGIVLWWFAGQTVGHIKAKK